MRHGIWCAAGIVLMGVVAGATSAQVTIEKVVSSTAASSGFTFTSLDPFPGLNNVGEVLFVAEYDDSGTTRQGIFRADTAIPGTPVTKLLDNSGIYSSFMTNTSFINDSGVVASRAERDDADVEIITVDSLGTVTTVASTSGAFSALGAAPSINNSGTVAFGARLDADGASGAFTGIYRASPPAAPTPVETISDGTYDAFFLPILNESGDVLYFGSNAVGDGGVLVREATGGAQTPIALSNPAGPNTQAIPYDLNDLGDAVYVGRDFTTSERSVRVYDESTALTDIVAEPSDGFVFSAIPEVAINNNGMVVFNDGTTGLYFGGNPLTDAIIEVGDPLFGDTVFAVGGGKAINDQNQFAFLYALENGEVGIALVTIPEPAALAPAILACILLRRKRRIRQDQPG